MAAEISQEIQRRRPHPSYKGKNGFDDAPLLNNAIEARRLAEYVLDNDGLYFPSMAQIQSSVEHQQQPETSSTLKQRIADLEEQHQYTVASLARFQAAEYHRDALDQYLACDESVPRTPAISSLRAASQTAASFTIHADDALSRLQHAHSQSILPLQKRYFQLRALAHRLFPRTRAEWSSMENRDAQLRTARYLTADRVRQQAMLDEFQWASRQVQPLEDVYRTDEDFRNEVQAIIREAENLKTRDPRTKRTASLNTPMDVGP